MKAKDWLWTIFEVAREERTDGDNFQGDMSTAPDCFLNALREEGKHYRCLSGLDRKAQLAELPTDEDKTAFLNEAGQLIREHYKELTAAFTAGDSAAFRAALDE